MTSLWFFIKKKTAQPKSDGFFILKDFYNNVSGSSLSFSISRKYL